MSVWRDYKGSKSYEEAFNDSHGRKMLRMFSKNNIIGTFFIVAILTCILIGTVFWIILKENIAYRWYQVIVPYIIALIVCFIFFCWRSEKNSGSGFLIAISIIAFLASLFLVPFTSVRASSSRDHKVDIFDGTLYYTIMDDGTFAVVKNGNYSYDLSEVNIPSEVQGRKVTKIGYYAFYDCTSLTSITIPDSVTSIDYNAFWGCSSLANINYLGTIKSWCDMQELESLVCAKNRTLSIDGEQVKGDLVIPSTVTSIPSYAFAGSNLTSVTFKENSQCTSIESAAFNGCSSLTSVTIPDSVKNIGDYAFYNCSSLASITIPDSVTSIGDSAFRGCNNLENVVIGNGAILHAFDFHDNDKLKTVILGNGIESIVYGMFSGCSSLTSITIPSTVTSIRSSAFDGCSSLEKFIVDEKNTEYSSYDGVLYNKDKTELLRIPEGVSGTLAIPDSVTRIGYYAFDGCSSLEKFIVDEKNTEYSSYDGVLYNKDKTRLIRVPQKTSGSFIIPDGVRIIDSLAFAGCSSLTSVTIPYSVTSIGEYALGGCRSLENITVDERNTKYSSYNGSLYNINKTELICVPQKASGSFVIPASVTSIEAYAFQGCGALKSITIPNGVTSIGKFAFDACSSLTIYCEIKSNPLGWDKNWNFDNRPVVWDCNNCK